MTSLLTTETLWYTGRGAGVVSLALLTLVVVLGIVGRSGRPLPGLPRFTVGDLHRNVSLIAIGLVLVHVVMLYLDPYAQLRLFDLLIPFGAAYRPFWVGLGTLAAELLALLILSSLVRRRIGAPAWRLIHWLSYGLWPIAWLHGWFSGTDAGSGWFRLVAVCCAAAVGLAVAWRLSPRFIEFDRPSTAEPTRVREELPR